MWVCSVYVCFLPRRSTCCLCTPTSSSLCPLYVLLGRCSVILSLAGCLYDPWTEIWLASPECLSFFPFPSLSPPLLFCTGLHCHCSSLCPLLCCFSCMPASLSSSAPPLKDEISSASADMIFSMLNLAYPSSLLLLFWFFIFRYPTIVLSVWSEWQRKGYCTLQW